MLAQQRLAENCGREHQQTAQNQAVEIEKAD